MQKNGDIQDLKSGNIRMEIEKVVFRHCSPDWVMSRHRIKYSNLTFIVSGEANYLLGNTPYHVGAGSLIYVPHGDVRQASLVRENPMHCYSVDFYAWGSSGTPLNLPLPYVSFLSNDYVINDLFSRMNVCWLNRSPYMQLRMKALLLLVLYHLLFEIQQPNHLLNFTDDRIAAITTYIGRNYASDLRLETFAEQYHLNKVYLGALFKRDTGLTFHQYLTRARLNAAEDLLSSEKYNIDEVAYLSGFRDASYFSRVFYKYFNVRPGKYKRMEKPQEPKALQEDSAEP